MTIVVPVAITPAGLPLPDPSDRATFSARKLEQLRWANNEYSTGSKALADASYSNALDARDSATAAGGSAASANLAAANTAALANFKGTWASQVGAINKPASVQHNGAFWALLNNLADVTASQPGVTADWQVCGGAFPVVVMAGNMTAKPWTSYLIPGPYTLTLPAISGTGQQVEVVVLAGVTGAIVTPAGTDKIRSTTGAMDVTAPFSATLKDTGASYGWV